MLLKRHTGFSVLLLLIFCQFAVPSFGQQGITFDIKKPPEYENRVLGSEKSDKKKFSTPRRFIQNTVTHYNYFFNANVKLNEVLARAKASFTDDYSQLIPFYNYTLDATAADSIQLDSISYKSQTGIVLHDLRNDWADNLYLLWGASYYLAKQFDSARMMFQFINYAFAEKEKDGYYRTIGSARDGNDPFIISSKEKKGVLRKVFTEPPSRNDAFIWQIRNYLAQDQFAQAASLIQILKIDPTFPPRLQNDLEEVQALAFYKQRQWDSCAYHLSLALSNATNKQERSRWEYLIGQLYEMTGQLTESEKYYSKSIGHTTDPILEIYARLSSVRVNKDSSADYIDRNIATLVKMAHRDKYQDYRDIIYYMAAQMELERKNIDGALSLLLRSTKYTSNNPVQRNKAFLQLAELSFTKRQYRQSYNFYDSLKLDDTITIKDPEAITARKTILAQLADNIEIINRQDSLQKLAGMPEEERRTLIKKLTRQLRRQQGLKDDASALNPISLPSSQQQPAPSLFADNSKKGEWYFYNSSLRQKGLTDFKGKWGTRPNADNWRRSAALSAIIRTQAQATQTQYQTAIAEKIDAGQTEITFDNLYDMIPLTQEKMKQSNDSIQGAMFTLGILYIQQLEDCSAGTETFEQLRVRFPDFTKMDEVLFNLYYCYNKNGEISKAAAIKSLMNSKFPTSNFNTIVTTGKNPQSKGPGEQATKAYENIYDLFIEGNFEEAIARKKAADSTYSRNYWSPQLLYIEAVYYVKQRQDSTAKVVLNNIIARFGGTPLAAKATTLLDVLGRRAQIEEELRNLVINIPPDDSASYQQPVTIVTAPVQNHADTTTVPKIITAPPKDTAIAKPVVKPPVAIVPTKPTIDSSTIKPPPKPVVPASTYAFETDVPYYVVVVLTKVDPIFVSEARNAFARHNRDTYYNKQMDAELVEIDKENQLLLISPFKNLQEALDYVDQTKPRTASEIIPWLKGGKYSYSIITARNLGLLKESKDIPKYSQFLEQHVPGKF